MLVLQDQIPLVQKSLASSKKAIVIDCETNITTFQDERYCMGISLCIDGECFYIPTCHKEWGTTEPTSVDVTGLFDNLPNVPVVFHNAKFDLQVLAKLDLEIPKNNLYCSMLMAHLIDEEQFSFGLDELVSKHLGINKEIKLAKAMKSFNWEEVPIEVMAKYAEQDARVTYQLFFYLKNQFEKYEEVWKIDREFLYLLMEMEQKGVRIDVSKIKLAKKAAEIEIEEFKNFLGFDPAKRKLLHKYLFEDLGLKPISYTDKGSPQANNNFFEKTNHPICTQFLRYSDINKRLTSYYNSYLRLEHNGRLHPQFKQNGTVTGRLSCYDPNTQQIPRDDSVKKFFLPEEECELWEIDYRTLELRLAAVYSEQENLLDIFRQEGDAHQLTANLLGISRQHAKTVNFAIIYGAGKDALAFQLGCTIEQAASILFDFRKSYPKLFKKMNEATESAKANHGEIRMWSGRRRHFKFSGDYHKAFNSIVQGGGFQIVKIGMLNLREARFDIRNQVHDSVWINIPKEETYRIEEAEKLMSDWTEEMFGLKFSVESKRLA